MNILHLEASPGWGGQEIRILREAEGMRSRGHQVILGVMRKGGLGVRARAAGFTVYELDFRKKYWIGCLVRLAILLHRHKIDLVNTHSSLDSWIGGIAARLLQIPVVRTRHLSTAIKPGWNSRILYGKLADFVVTTCASIVPMICTQAGRRIESVRSIPTGVDPQRIIWKSEEQELFRQKLKILPSDFLIGTACFMRSWKGISDLLQAAHLLRSQPQYKWVIIGGGHKETYEAKARALQLEGIVFFTGHLESPFAAIASLDVFALLSTAHEGVSQAILQAAFLRKPLVATATGGLGEVCIDGVTGIQVPPFSPSRVVEAVTRLKEDIAFSQKLAAAARTHVEKHFTLTHTLDGMQQVYTEVLQRKGKRR